jgi:peroxiredoxin
MRKRIVLCVMTAVLVSFAIPSLRSPRAAEAPCPSCPSFGVQRFPDNKEAPPFSLKSLEGNMCSLTDLRGKPVLLFFWGSWCDACKEDIVLLEKFAQGKKDQFTTITIVVDGEREKKIRKIKKDYKLTLPVLLILKEKVIDTYEIRMVPQVVFISREGCMLGKAIGQRDWSKPEAWSTVKELFGLN